MNYEKDKFEKGARGLLKGDKIFLVEGELNKAFYQNFPEIRKYTLKNGGSCSKIINEVCSFDNYGKL